MATKKYISFSNLTSFLDNLKSLFATKTEMSTKANVSHTHAIADVSSLQAALNGKAATSHGTHVTYSSTAPVMDGSASVGSASTIARSDHKHPTDTSRAAQTDLDALETAVAGKAASSHSHSISNVTNLQSTLDGKAASSHTHTVSQISDLTATTTELNYMDGVTSSVQTQLDGKAASGHTHSYAGSSSAGGAATSANKLNTNAGSATQPVYFSNGVPVATSYTLGKSVPSNAVFTDTHYSSKNVVGATNATSNTATALTNGNVYINSVENGVVTSSHKISGSGATTVTADTAGNIVISSTDNNTTYNAAGSALGLVKSGGDVTISSGVITINDDSHNHIIANVDNLQASLDAKQDTITGAATTIAGSNLTANRALISNGSGKVAISDITSTELGCLDGVESNIQTQLDGKAASGHNHAASNITSGILSSDILPTVPIAKGGTGATTAAGALTNLGITATATELNYVDGVTSNIQTQLNGKSETSHTHSYLPLSGGTITGQLDAYKVFRNGNTFYNVLEFASTATVDEIVIKTKIPFISGNSMPLVHLKGYAYGESATIEMTVAFYIYNNKFTNMGVVSSCPWKPSVYLSSYTENNTKYIAISFSGSIYYPRFVVDYVDIWSGSSNRDYSSGWTSSNRASGGTTSVIPSTDKVEVPYKAIANNISGNAATATNVAWSGVTSKPSYYDAKAIKSITRSGTTFTYTCMDGTTGTFTQQDNNTTYSVATTSSNGLMSSSDKSKLDAVELATVTEVKTYLGI